MFSAIIGYFIDACCCPFTYGYTHYIVHCTSKELLKNSDYYWTFVL